MMRPHKSEINVLKVNQGNSCLLGHIENQQSRSLLGLGFFGLLHILFFFPIFSCLFAYQFTSVSSATATE